MATIRILAAVALVLLIGALPGLYDLENMC
jgi:hypothetical protein